MRHLLPMMLLLIAPAAFASHATPYGEPMPESEPVSIAVAAADPAAYAGKPMRFSGRITQVCQKKGCWVVLEADGHSARVMAKDHGFAVPMDSAGEAHAWGVRHMQMVHFIQSPLGDHQTAEPRHGGISPLGRDVVAACRKHGIVVDLAHATAAFVDGALDASDAAMVWSHSWISRDGGTWQDPGYIARSLSLASW